MKAVEAMAAVMADVRAVGKEGVNKHQNYNFRGIDGVLNAVGPAFRAHGIVPMPISRNLTYGEIMVGQGKDRKPIGHAIVTVEYQFYGPEGDYLSCVVDAEAMDSGDKAVSKAYSVAYRTALIQALALPTDDPDPDADSYERSAGPTPDEIAAGQGFESVKDRDERHADVAARIKALPDSVDRRPFKKAQADHGWPMQRVSLSALLDLVEVAEGAVEEEKTP